MGVTVNGIEQPDNIESYSVVENATPLDPADTSAGFGQVEFTTVDWPTSRWLRNKEVVLTDDHRGKIAGIVRSISGNGHIVRMAGDSELGKLNVPRMALPMEAMLSEVFQYYMDLVGIATPLDFQAHDRLVSVPSFTVESGPVWDHFRDLASAYSVEVALVFDTVVIREHRTFDAYMERATDYSYENNTQTSARTVLVNYYNHYPIEDGEVYPVPEGDEPQIFQVEAGETVTFEVPMSASLTEVNQPEHVYIAKPDNAGGTKGCYSVVGQDNLPLTVSQWAAGGGSVEAEISKDDPSLLYVHVTGAHWTHLAPYRIAASAGGTDYNSIHITGMGIARVTRTIQIYTGADENVVTDEVGTTVENPYITTQAQAYHVGQHTAAAYSGGDIEITGQAIDVNRHTSDKHMVATTFRDFDRDTEGNWDDMAGFSAEHDGQSMEDFSVVWENLFLHDYRNQIWGNVVGARVFRENEAYYRIVEGTTDQGILSFRATMDTIIDDFNAVWRGETMGTFSEHNINMTSDEFSALPLYDPRPYREPLMPDEEIESP